MAKKNIKHYPLRLPEALYSDLVILTNSAELDRNGSLNEYIEKALTKHVEDEKGKGNE